MSLEAGPMPIVERPVLDLGASLLSPMTTCIYEQCPPGMVCEGATSRRCISFEQAQGTVLKQYPD